MRALRYVMPLSLLLVFESAGVRQLKQPFLSGNVVMPLKF